MIRKLESKSHLEKIIEKGGSVVSDKLKEEKKWSVFPLRIRYDISLFIEKCLETRVGLSKTAWILEAIQEKIKRESSNEMP